MCCRLTGNTRAHIAHHVIERVLLDARGTQVGAAAADGAIAVNPPDDLTVTFLYLGGAEPEEISRQADDAWMQEATAHLLSLVEEAAGPEFPATPSANCTHCDFIKFCEVGRAHLDAS